MTTVRIRSNGTITLPARFRKKYGLKEGDFLTLIDLGDGKLMFTPGVSKFMSSADKIAKALQDAGVTLDEMLEALDEERQRYYEEHYAKK
jgi:AbrB family looped-hinge helix DNA binding protein